MTLLVDFNLDGYALLLLGILTKLGWLELVSIRFVTFKEAGLSMDASDRLVWRYAPENQMMILTANRNMKGDDSLEQVMREENTADSFPVLTMLEDRQPSAALSSDIKVVLIHALNPYLASGENNA